MPTEENQVQLHQLVRAQYAVLVVKQEMIFIRRLAHSHPLLKSMLPLDRDIAPAQRTEASAGDLIF